MEKDFHEWHTLKKNLHAEKDRPFFHDREIWFCSLGSNIGFEQDGSGETFLRPVIVFKKFNKEVFLGIPLTKTLKRTRFYFPLTESPSTAILSQIRLFDGKRLQYHVGTVSEEEFEKLKEKFRRLIA